MINYNNVLPQVYLNYFAITDYTLNAFSSTKIGGDYENYIYNGYAVLPINVWFINKTQFILSQLHIQVGLIDLTNRLTMDPMDSAVALTESFNTGHSKISLTTSYDLHWNPNATIPTGDLFHIYFAFMITKQV